MNIPHGIDIQSFNLCLESMLTILDVSVFFLSYDDFLLDQVEMQTLKNANPFNKFIQISGMAGTHDIPKGTQIMNRIINCRPSEKILVPRSQISPIGIQPIDDKSMLSTGQVNVLIIQNWMLGHRPINLTTLKMSNNGMDLINLNLKRYKEWEQLMDALMVIQPDDISFVKQWKTNEE